MYYTLRNFFLQMFCILGMSICLRPIKTQLYKPGPQILTGQYRPVLQGSVLTATFSGSKFSHAADKLASARPLPSLT